MHIALSRPSQSVNVKRVNINDNFVLRIFFFSLPLFSRQKWRAAAETRLAAQLHSHFLRDKLEIFREFNRVEDGKLLRATTLISLER